MPLRTYSLSVWIVTSQLRLSEASASITAVSSMRLLVVSFSPPNSSFSCSPVASHAPQPPGRVALARAVAVDRDVGLADRRAAAAEVAAWPSCDLLGLSPRLALAALRHGRRGLRAQALLVREPDQAHAAHALDATSR